jgi:hypothetical protein
MYRFVAVSIAAAAAVALSTVSASAAPQDSVTGSGKIDFQGQVGQLIVNAHGDTSDARGHMKFRIETASGVFSDLEADVTCVRVFGNRAAVFGAVTNKPEPFADYVGVFIVDNGQPGDGVPDLVRGSLRNTDSGCFFTTPFAPIEQGNFTVKDR